MVWSPQARTAAAAARKAKAPAKKTVTRNDFVKRALPSGITTGAHGAMAPRSPLSGRPASAVAKTNVPKQVVGSATKAPAQIKQAPIGPQHPAKKGRKPTGGGSAYTNPGYNSYG